MLYDVLTGKRPNDFKSSNFKRIEYSSKEGVAEEHGYIIKMELVQYTIHSTGCCQTNCSSSVTDTWQISKTNTIKWYNHKYPQKGLTKQNSWYDDSFKSSFLFQQPVKNVKMYILYIWKHLKVCLLSTYWPLIWLWHKSSQNVPYCKQSYLIVQGRKNKTKPQKPC